MGSTPEKRKHVRIGYDMPLEFSVNVLEFGTPRMENFPGRGVDITDQGLGFLTEIQSGIQLEPGLLISVKQEDGSYQNAEVRWVGELDGKLRVGVLWYNV
ncbi:MAG: PilZ domain-containing protein [Thermodesulfovibrionales bacterium]